MDPKHSSKDSGKQNTSTGKKTSVSRTTKTVKGSTTPKKSLTTTTLDTKAKSTSRTEKVKPKSQTPTISPNRVTKGTPSTKSTVKSDTNTEISTLRTSSKITERVSPKRSTTAPKTSTKKIPSSVTPSSPKSSTRKITSSVPSSTSHAKDTTTKAKVTKASPPSSKIGTKHGDSSSPSKVGTTTKKVDTSSPSKIGTKKVESKVGTTAKKVDSSTISKVGTKKVDSSSPSKIGTKKVESKVGTTTKKVDSSSSSVQEARLSWATRKTLKSSSGVNKNTSKGGQYSSLSKITSEPKRSTDSLKRNVTMRLTKAELNVSPTKLKDTTLSYSGYNLRSSKIQTLREYAHFFFDNTIHVWNMEKEECVHIFTGHMSPIHTMVLGYDYLCVSSSVSETLIWNFLTGRIERNLKGCSLVALHPNLKKIAMVLTNWIEIYDIQRGRIVRSIQCGKMNVLSLCFIHGSNKLMGGCDDGQLRIWNIDTGVLEKTLKGHNAPVKSVFSCPDGRECYTTSEDRLTKVWSISTGKCLHSYQSKQESEPMMVHVQKGKKEKPDTESNAIEKLFYFLAENGDSQWTVKENESIKTIDKWKKDESPPYFYVDI